MSTEEERSVFIYASDYEALRTEQLASVVTHDNARLLSGTPIFQILNNVELPLAKSLGSSRVGAISFTSYFGPNVTEGLASIEKAESELNNIACLGYEDGDRVLWGGRQAQGEGLAAEGRYARRMDGMVRPDLEESLGRRGRRAQHHAGFPQAHPTHGRARLATDRNRVGRANTEA